MHFTLFIARGASRFFIDKTPRISHTISKSIIRRGWEYARYRSHSEPGKVQARRQADAPGNPEPIF